jgi:glucose-6-phosphate dehydrogenase assembly protein OpcA
MALGRVLTLIVVVDEATPTRPSRSPPRPAASTRAASSSSSPAPSAAPIGLDAQIRLGGDAGASEVVVLRLYGPLAGHGQSVVTPLLLPDSPIVAWWPGEAPATCARPDRPMAQRRITDSRAEAHRPATACAGWPTTYQPGDTDLAWTRVTLWRGLLAAALDGPPYEPVTERGRRRGARLPVG